MRLGVLSDVHWTPDPATPASWHNPFDFARLPARLDAAAALLAKAQVDAVVMSGDLSHAGDAASARTVLERVAARTQAPVLIVAGNHDGHESEDRLERCVTGNGEMLTAAGRDVAGIHVAGVEIEADLRSETFRWASTAHPALAGPVDVLVSHFPLLSRAERLAELGLAYSGDLTNRKALRAHLVHASPVVVLSGHIHVRESHASGGVLQLSAGALVEAPYEVSVVDVHAARGEVRVRRRVRVLGPPGPVCDPVLAPADETWTYRNGEWHRAARHPVAVVRPPARPSRPPRSRRGP